MLTAVLDLDGTLIDSDEALIAPFLELGIERDAVQWGHVLEHECERLGVAVEDYLERYDPNRAPTYPGVDDLVGELGTWAICSNKHPHSGHAELARLGWTPAVTRFADATTGTKRLGPVLDQLGLSAEEIYYVGDTDHDRRVAREVGCRYGIAGWNPRARAEPGEDLLSSPAQILDRLAGR